MGVYQKRTNRYDKEKICHEHYTHFFYYKGIHPIDPLLGHFYLFFWDEQEKSPLCEVGFKHYLSGFESTCSMSFCKRK